MSASNPTSVSIAIGSSMYGRFEDLPNTPSHDIAEFVDNALQSSRDKRPELLALDPGYKLRVIINIDWDETETKSSPHVTFAPKSVKTDTIFLSP